MEVNITTCVFLPAEPGIKISVERELLPVKLIIGDSFDVTHADEPAGIFIACFKKGKLPKLTWPDEAEQVLDMRKSA